MIIDPAIAVARTKITERVIHGKLNRLAEHLENTIVIIGDQHRKKCHTIEGKLISRPVAFATLFCSFSWS